MTDVSSHNAMERTHAPAAQRWNDTTIAKSKEDTITRVMADRQQPVDA